LSPEDIPRTVASSVPEWDSLAALTLVSLIEEEFNLRINLSEIGRLTSFAEIFDYLAANVRS
jgi:acyl carrier protein